MMSGAIVLDPRSPAQRSHRRDPAQGREIVRRSVAVHWIELRQFHFNSRQKLKSGGHHADNRVTAILDAERERRKPRRRPEIWAQYAWLTTAVGPAPTWRWSG